LRSASVEISDWKIHFYGHYYGCSDNFVEEVEALTGKRLKEGKKGRPDGWRKEN
jgi:hypothetical protein